MKLRDLKNLLRSVPDASPRLLLPDGDEIPAHFHITEVGHVTKRFIDCGGQLHDRKDTCVLQTWLGSDIEHRLNAGTFAKILDLGAQVLPHDEIEVEVEYDCCVISQYPVASAAIAGNDIEIQLGEKRTDCLAKERCGLDEEGCGRNENTTASEDTAETRCC
jgi:hypothetical protein